MSALAWLAICTLGLPAMYLVSLAVSRRRRVSREAQMRNNRSVAAIAARVEQEREQAERLVRWPRADPDRGAVRDNRPTDVLPRVARHARPDDVRPTTGLTFPPQRKARP